MVRFWLAFLLILVVFLTFVFWFGGKNYSYIRQASPASEWSQVNQDRWNGFFQWFFRLLGLVLAVFLLFPMARDFPSAIGGKTLSVSGKLDVIERQNRYPTSLLFQTIQIDGTHYICYGYGYFFEDREYVIEYLPHSRCVVSASFKD